MARKRDAKTKRIRLMLTCIGRRVELLRAFERAGGELGLDLEIHGADSSKFAPAMQLVPYPHLVPTIASGSYIDALLEIVHEREIDLLVPLLDSELAVLAGARERFAQVGCRAVLSAPSVIATCADKLATFRMLRAAGIDTPHTWPWVAIVEQKKHRFPYYLKPRAGSAARGNYVIHTLEELSALGKRVPDAIVQEFIRGEEYTLDVYTGLDGVPRCAVPRKRLEVRTGEVSKAVVVKDERIIDAGLGVVRTLAECRGVVTVQCMVTPGREVKVIEINPRFGGGAPLAIAAGADFPAWLLQEHLGRRPRIDPLGFCDGMIMLRYDESVFVESEKKLLGQARKPAADRKAGSRAARLPASR